MASPCLSTEEVISIINLDTKADNEENDCCSEDLIKSNFCFCKQEAEEVRPSSPDFVEESKNFAVSSS